MTHAAHMHQRRFWFRRPWFEFNQKYFIFTGVNAITIEKAKYIIAHYSSLLTPNETKGLRHLRSTFKLENARNEKLSNMYYKIGWLSDDLAILQLLSDGEDQFMLNCAERILKENSEEVYINLCPKCNRLARTPYAKQCGYCHHDWH